MTKAMPERYHTMSLSQRMLLAVLIISMVLATSASAAREQHERMVAQAAAEGKVPLYDNLGVHHYAITTSVPLAQRYFDQGLRLYYAFNHREAIRAFTEAARLDPSCAMCYWAIALAHGPNIIAPMDAAAGRAAYCGDSTGGSSERRRAARVKRI